TRDFGTLAEDAIAYARDGFEISAGAATVFTEGAQLYRAEDPSFAAWRRMYADVGPGTWLRQPALARTLERLAAGGPDAPYQGPVRGAPGPLPLQQAPERRPHRPAPRRARWCDATRRPRHPRGGVDDAAARRVPRRRG